MYRSYAKLGMPWKPGTKRHILAQKLLNDYDLADYLMYDKKEYKYKLFWKVIAAQYARILSKEEMHEAVEVAEALMPIVARQRSKPLKDWRSYANFLGLNEPFHLSDDVVRFDTSVAMEEMIERDMGKLDHYYKGQRDTNFHRFVIMREKTGSTMYDDVVFPDMARIFLEGHNLPEVHALMVLWEKKHKGESFFTQDWKGELTRRKL
jgi:hypothetical protein